jgi:hypothetical protein
MLAHGGIERKKAMNAPKLEGEHISGAKEGERPKFVANQKSNVNGGYFLESD